MTPIGVLTAMVKVLEEKVVHLEQQDRHLGVESVADLASRVLHLEQLQQFTENHPSPPAATTVSPGSTAWVISEDDTDDPQVLRAMIKQLKKEAEQQMKKCEELQATLLSRVLNSASAGNSASAAADITALATIPPPPPPQPAPQPAPQPSAAAAARAEQSRAEQRSAEQLAGRRVQSSPQQQQQQHLSGSTTTAAAPAATCKKPLGKTLACEDCTLF